MEMTPQEYDVVIIGAGISGVNTAYRIQSSLPSHTYVLLEARNALGGTWDLFRYPGIRSDSDLYTFGFSWYPWPSSRPIAEASEITNYMKEAASTFGIDKHILYDHKVETASWSTVHQTWSLNVTHGDHVHCSLITTRFIVFGTGYYDYDRPLPAQIPGLDTFSGQVIHPQFWPEGFDYTGKDVVVIGSGATAITIIPKLAETAAHVTMLQRSPTYILSLPNKREKSCLERVLPVSLSRKMARIRRFVTSAMFFKFCRTFPNAARWLLQRETCKRLPQHIPYNPHFIPRYNPWDQRLCICPDGDFFNSLHTGRADVKTDTIATVTGSGIELASGETLKTDVIVTATGLKLQFGGNVKILVDGKPYNMSDKYMWNGILLQDLPNAALVIGYTNASWTLGADATGTFVTRFLRHMHKKRIGMAIPRVHDATQLTSCRLLDLSSTYVTAAERNVPKAAEQGPWQPRKGYLSDMAFAKYGSLDNSLELIERTDTMVTKKHV
ncbi:putative flavin-binding monooxygenase [Aspergillus avenaceus]|uniref:Putative flavin-binding monooxygenase n=1 Tax=Aspergillus avenaceus TaxID=36643 RepID=A0A5N6U5E8_ASPAV|nr:putative flavin-binding monooxygenase [Aspergillus avenaceus]